MRGHSERTFDFTLLFLVVLLTATGIILIYSANHNHSSEWMRGIYKQQAVLALAGFIIMYAVSMIPLGLFYRSAYLLYFLSLIPLLYLAFNNQGGDVDRWLIIGGRKIFQPSEFAKIGVMLALARSLAGREISLTNPSSMVFPGILAAVPFILVLKQPDLGTALVFAAVILPMFFWAGLTLREIIYLLTPLLSLITASNHIIWGIFFLLLIFILYRTEKNLVLAVGIALLNFFVGVITLALWNNLKDYQKNRILSFINPNLDPYGAGYQVIQSKVALGSGEIWGKGFLNSSQARLNFLPAQHTDFIFSVLGEQFGFVGCTALILLFFVFLTKIITLTMEHNSRFVNLIITAVFAQLSFHIIENIAMTAGLMPVTGLPLPFISYGGSFLITSLILIGLIINLKKTAINL
ncbi:MAG: rod shape-determining protein RodA [Fibrobacterota bacterium]